MMKKPWQAEHEVSMELAKSLIASQFPELGALNATLLGKGWDNTAFLMNDDYVFRFPRRQIAVSLLENEIKLLPYLKDQLPLQIPVPQFLGKPSELYPWPFAGYAKLPGVTACDIEISDETRINNAVILGEFLAKLHAIDIEEAKKRGAEIDRIGRIDINKRLPMIKENLAFIEKYDLFDTTLLHRYLQAIVVKPLENKLCLMHGDLYAKHLLVNHEGKITGIIDWGDTELGHPAIDIAIAHSFLPPIAHDLFRQTYGEMSDDTWELARVRALYSSSMMAMYAHDVQDDNLLREALRGLTYICQGLSSETYFTNGNPSASRFS